MSRVVEGLKAWEDTAKAIYAAHNTPMYIHSFWRHEVSYRSQVVPDVSVTIEVLLPHYTDRDEVLPCPLCGGDCERRAVDCCDAMRFDCEVATDDEVRVCIPVDGQRVCEFERRLRR